MLYLVIKKGFDVMENHIRNAIHSEPLGYLDVEDESEVKESVQDLASKDKPYKAWDGETYPRYETVSLNKLS